MEARHRTHAKTSSRRWLRTLRRAARVGVVCLSALPVGWARGQDPPAPPESSDAYFAPQQGATADQKQEHTVSNERSIESLIGANVDRNRAENVSAIEPPHTLRPLKIKPSRDSAPDAAPFLPPGPKAETASPERPPSAGDPGKEVSSPFEPARVLAVVGGEPILVGDLIFEVNQMIEKFAAQAPDHAKQAQREQLLARMLPKYIDRRLMKIDIVRGLPEGADVEKMFASLGQSFDDEALPKALDENGFASPLEFDGHLRLLGSSLRRYREAWIEDQFVRYFVSQKMKSSSEVTHAELWDYYQEHRDQYDSPPRVHWEQLLVRFDRTPNRETARRQIAELGNEVVFGASLDAVAKRSSHAANASLGGDQGWIGQGSIAWPDLDRELFELPVGELSDIIETPVGFHIVRVKERNPGGLRPFVELQGEIRETLLQQRQNEQFEKYIRSLRAEIPFEIVDLSVTLPETYTSQ